MSVTQIRDWLDQEIENARTIFRDYLYLGLDDIPIFHPSELMNNWVANRPDQSFINDSRNRNHVGRNFRWLFDEFMENVELKAHWLKQTSNGEWKWKSAVVSEYEDDVQ